MGHRLVPNGDDDFNVKASNLAHAVTKDPGRFSLTADDGEQLTAAVDRFRAALQTAKFGAARSPAATRAKDQARAELKRVFVRCMNVIRISEDADDTARHDVGLKVSDGIRRARTVPQEPPELRFVRSLHEGSNATPMHELSFRGLGSRSKAKPEGATRLELYYQLIAPGAPVPPPPRADYGGPHDYLGSFSSNPIKLVPPMSRTPMLIVYWGRWADANHRRGPWSRTVVSRIEGWTEQMLFCASFASKRPPAILEDPSNKAREPKYSVTVRDAQYEYLDSSDAAAPSLPTPKEDDTRQLEGPAADDDAKAA